MNRINIGIIGFGTVGSGVVRTLIEDRAFLKKRLGLEINISKVCDVEFRTRRTIKLSRSLITKNVNDILSSEEIDIVVELVGGIHPAKNFILRALKNGKHVVTANKALLAQEGAEIFKEAIKYNREVLFEAAVCGGIPIVKSIREGLIANDFDSIVGIINGTSNYILSQMQDKNYDFRDALQEAKKRGLAERNPSLDIDGVDAAHKISILVYLAFGMLIDFRNIFIQGIKDISIMDIVYANELGYVIKPLAIANKAHGKFDVRVHPALIPKKHIFASVKGAFNAILVSGDMTKELVFIGRGAGQNPTASAVVSDIVDLSRDIDLGFRGRRLFMPYRIGRKKDMCKIDDVQTRYYIRFMAIDKPGVLAKISGILGKFKISIASVTQKERKRARIVPIIMMIHEVREKDLKNALDAIDKLGVIKKQSIAIRVEG